jgi:hypothetical protein
MCLTRVNFWFGKPLTFGIVTDGTVHVTGKVPGGWISGEFRQCVNGVTVVSAGAGKIMPTSSDFR